MEKIYEYARIIHTCGDELSLMVNTRNGNHIIYDLSNETSWTLRQGYDKLIDYLNHNEVTKIEWIKPELISSYIDDKENEFTNLEGYRMLIKYVKEKTV